MLAVREAADMFLGDLERGGYAARTLTTYQRILDKFADGLSDDFNVSDVNVDHIRRFLDRWRGKSTATRAHAYSVMSSFCRWLYLNDKVAENPMGRLARLESAPRTSTSNP